MLGSIGLDRKKTKKPASCRLFYRSSFSLPLFISYNDRELAFDGIFFYFADYFTNISAINCFKFFSQLPANNYFGFYFFAFGIKIKICKGFYYTVRGLKKHDRIL